MAARTILTAISSFVIIALMYRGVPIQGSTAVSQTNSTEINSVRTVLQDGVGPALSTVPTFFLVAMVVGVLMTVALLR